MRYLLAAMGMLISSLAAAQTTRPTTRPADFQIADAREQVMDSFTFCYVSTEASIATIRDAVGALLPQIERGIQSGAIRPVGPMVFIYQGSPESFTLDVGVAVAADAKVAEPFSVRTVPPFRCMAVLYSGPLSPIGKAYEKLWQQGFQRRQSLPEWREMYLYWAGEASANNVIHIEMGLR